MRAAHPSSVEDGQQCGFARPGRGAVLLAGSEQGAELACGEPTPTRQRRALHAGQVLGPPRLVGWELLQAFCFAQDTMQSGQHLVAGGGGEARPGPCGRPRCAGSAMPPTAANPRCGSHRSPPRRSSRAPGAPGPWREAREVYRGRVLTGDMRGGDCRRGSGLQYGEISHGGGLEGLPAAQRGAGVC
jgi:hypothetical protein